MILQGTEAIVYLYVLNDRTQKFDVNKLEFTKGSSEFKVIKDDEEAEEDDDKKEQNPAEAQEEQPPAEAQEEQPPAEA